MSVNVPLHKWRSADPAILIGRRCIAQTDQDVIIDGRLELIRLPDALAQPMRQLDQALAQIGSLPADPTNEPTKENKQ